MEFNRDLAATAVLAKDARRDRSLPTREVRVVSVNTHFCKTESCKIRV
jgi:hypothetical protein